MSEIISPKYKKWLVWGIGMGTVMLVVALTGPKQDDGGRRKEKEVRHVLTDFDTRKVGVDSLAANIKILHAENSNLTRELGSLKHQLELVRKNSGLLGPGQTGNPENTAMSEEIRSLREELKLIKSLLPMEMQNMRKKNAGVQGNGIENSDGARAGAFGKNSGQSVNIGAADAEGFPGQDARQHLGTGLGGARGSSSLSGENTGRPRKKGKGPVPGPRGIRHIRSLADAGFEELSRAADSRKESREKGNGNRGYYVPAGSILSGILLTGLDAPTKADAKNDPFPVLINIDKDALLPNSRVFDFRECFVIAAGFGDMSSERVYFRTESLNCVAESGRVLEMPLSGYAAGEDGKAGVRGRLVSKQGVLIARSLTAGFLEGLAGAFDVSPVPVINTTGSSGSMEYQSVYNSRALQGAAVSGSSKALERIASFYLKLAEEMFPVLEIDAARRVDIILTKGLSLDYSLSD